MDKDSRGAWIAYYTLHTVDGDVMVVLAVCRSEIEASRVAFAATTDDRIVRPKRVVFGQPVEAETRMPEPRPRHSAAARKVKEKAKALTDGVVNFDHISEEEAAAQAG